jgi:hypothetical protein
VRFREQKIGKMSLPLENKKNNALPTIKPENLSLKTYPYNKYAQHLRFGVKKIDTKSHKNFLKLGFGKTAKKPTPKTGYKISLTDGETKFPKAKTPRNNKSAQHLSFRVKKIAQNLMKNALKLDFGKPAKRSTLKKDSKISFTYDESKIPKSKSPVITGM